MNSTPRLDLSQFLFPSVTETLPQRGRRARSTLADRHDGPRRLVHNAQPSRPPSFTAKSGPGDRGAPRAVKSARVRRVVQIGESSLAPDVPSVEGRGLLGKRSRWAWVANVTGTLGTCVSIAHDTSSQVNTGKGELGPEHN